MICECCKEGFEVNAYRAETARFCSARCRAKVLTVGIYIGVRSVERSTRVLPYERPIYKKHASEVRKRDGYQCQLCGKQFVPHQRGLEVDHKIPIRSGGSDELTNLWALCSSCHRRKDNALRMAERAAVSK